MLSKIEIPLTITSETATCILNKILKEIKLSPIIEHLDVIKQNAGEEGIEVMTLIYPHVFKIQMKIIKEYGFPHTREGVLKFIRTMRHLGREDAEIARLHGLIKYYYLPPASENAIYESSVEEDSSEEEN